MKPCEQGFAQLMLLALIGVGSVGGLLAVQGLARFTDDRFERADDNLQQVAAATRAAYLRTGAFPGSLDALAAGAGLPTAGDWRIDPFWAGNDLEYRSQTGGWRVRSRGPDGRRATADDLGVDIGAEELVRLRQRGRLRLLRARLLTSPYRRQGSMSAADLQDLRTWTHAYAAARRSFLTSTTAERVVLQGAMDASRTSIAALCSLHACPPLPTRMNGASGLPQQLGLPDARALDGRGRRMLVDAAVGFGAAGNDRAGGTSDDM